MLRGEPSWHTSSTGPTSMPSSSEAVATSARRSPARSRDLDLVAAVLRQRPVVGGDDVVAQLLAQLVGEALGQPPGVDEHDASCGARWTSAAMRSITSPICSADATASSSPWGSSSARSRRRWWPVSTMAHGSGAPEPVSRSATSEMGRCVADSPTRWGRGPQANSTRSSVRARCDPRLSRATAWISSTMIVSTVASIVRLRAAVTSRYSDSGVVMTKLGGRRTIAARSVDVVSPVRTPTRRSGASRPSSAATSAISSEGALEVLGDVDGQRLERRHVDDLGPVGHGLAPGVGPVQAIDADEEPGQRLARAGRRGDERVAALGDLRPPLALGPRGSLGEPTLEPGGHRRVHAQTGEVARRPRPLNRGAPHRRPAGTARVSRR